MPNTTTEFKVEITGIDLTDGEKKQIEQQIQAVVKASTVGSKTLEMLSTSGTAEFILPKKWLGITIIRK